MPNHAGLVETGAVAKPSNVQKDATTKAETPPSGDLKKADRLLKEISAAKGISRQVYSSLKHNGPTKLRLVKTATHITSGDELSHYFSHSALCQVGLPYRALQADVRTWERRNGNVTLRINAGSAANPATGEFENVPLPWGPKVRLVQIYLDSMAIKTQKPVVVTSHKSLTHFVRVKLKLSDDGRTITSVKDALAQLAASYWQIGIFEDRKAVTINAQIIEAFEIWMQKDDRQRVLFPEFVQYSKRYFDNLLLHAVPLAEAAISSLSHNAMALDLYRWLAQRLDRVPQNCPTLLMWNVLHEQFGWNYKRLSNFRKDFKNTLAEVLSQYPQARGKVFPDAPNSVCKDGRGLWLEHAQPPVKKVSLLLP